MDGAQVKKYTMFHDAIKNIVRAAGAASPTATARVDGCPCPTVTTQVPHSLDDVNYTDAYVDMLGDIQRALDVAFTRVMRWSSIPTRTEFTATAFYGSAEDLIAVALLLHATLDGVTAHQSRLVPLSQ